MSESQNILELAGVRFCYSQQRSLFKRSEYAAIRGVDLSVRRGETVGILGRNGCGKSTLLRIIAGIYRPDSGEVRRYCSRISLLSLALGFDPLLSGRENAVLSGMLSGSSRKQVEDELEEIIDFAELGSFIDDPLKTYSTGMRARLGFSVALRLRTDLMLLDEVLSVGDVKFRQKAEKAMVERISSEQTVLMVSHSLPQLLSLSSRIVWIDNGTVRAEGEPEEVIDRYKRELGV